MKPEIILIGAGGHARACIDVIEQESKFEIAGLVGLEGEIGGSVNGYRIFASDEQLPALAKKFSYAMLTVGQISSPELRMRLFQKVANCGLRMAIVISPQAYVAPSVRIGEGTILMHGAIVNSNAKIGRNCILNTGSIVEHDAVIADDVHISTRVVINGGVRIGQGSFIGSGSIIREGLTIGERATIGMGSLVRSSIEPNSLFVEKLKT